MRKQIFMFLVAAVCLASCKKEGVDPLPNNGNNNGNDNPDPVPTTKLLKKMTETKNGVVTVYNFSYDAKKQLVSIKNEDQSDVTNFSYDNEGNVIKVESLQPDTRNVYEYHYENGLPDRATFKSYEVGIGEENLVEDDILHYTVEDGKVTKINMDMIVQQQELNFLLSYNNSGNVTRIETDGSTAYIAQFTYGTKKPVFPKVFKFVMDQAGYSLHFFAKNDIKSIRYDYPGTDYDSEEQIQYTYDAAGNILTANDGSSETTFEYQ